MIDYGKLFFFRGNVFYETLRHIQLFKLLLTSKALLFSYLEEKSYALYFYF